MLCDKLRCGSRGSSAGGWPQNICQQVFEYMKSVWLCVFLRFTLQMDVFFSASLDSGVDVLVHTMWKAGFPACKLTVRATNAEYAPLAWQAMERIIKA